MATHIAFRERHRSPTGPRRRCENVTLEIPHDEIFGIIGPANSGKTTLLKCINRTIDFVPRVQGRRARCSSTARMC